MKRLHGFCLLAVLGVVQGSVSADPTPERQAELRYLLRHDCGSCHGMRLEGGLGPPLTPHALEPLSHAQVTATILHGRPGTPMPPWRPFLTPDEAHWLASVLKGRQP